MKLAVSCALLIAAAASPALAQNVAPAAAPAQAAPVATPATATPGATATTAARFNLDTPIETIVADPQGKAVIDADIPPLTSHPAYDQFKSMSLHTLQPMSGGVLTDETLKKVETDLAAIK